MTQDADRPDDRDDADDRDASGALILKGEGLGEILSPAESLARLKAISVVHDPRDWDGGALEPEALARRLGVAPAAVQIWCDEGRVVALPNGPGSRLIPLAQFEGSRLLPGIPELLTIADGRPAVLWHWLMTPHIDFEATPPIMALREGRVREVLAAAERSLG